jgi:outer membrane protein
MYKITMMLLLAGVPALPLQAQEKITLEQAIREALEGNPELAMDAPALAAARSELDATRAGFFPRLDIEQSLQGGNNPVFAFGTLLNQRRFSEANFAIRSLNRPDPVKNIQTRIVAEQSIWDFGRTRERVEAARLGIDLTDRAHDDHVRQTILGVIEAYFSVSLSREAYDAAKTALQSSESIVSQAEARVGSGLAVEADLLRSQAYLAAARKQEIQTRGQVELATATLNRIMGRPLESPFDGTTPLHKAEFTLAGEQGLIAGLQQNRADYLRLKSELRQAELEVQSRKTQFLPTVGGFAQWEADNPSLTDAGGNNWTAGVTLRWNVYAGGSDAAMLTAARRRVDQKNLQLKAMQSAMALEVHRAFVQLSSAEQEVEAMRAAESQSQESLRILRNRYDAGLATITDVLSAETARSSARMALAEAIYNQRISLARLEHAAGILSPNSAAAK